MNEGFLLDFENEFNYAIGQEIEFSLAGKVVMTGTLESIVQEFCVIAFKLDNGTFNALYPFVYSTSVASDDHIQHTFNYLLKNLMLDQNGKIMASILIDEDDDGNPLIQNPLFNQILTVKTK